MSKGNASAATSKYCYAQDEIRFVKDKLVSNTGSPTEPAGELPRDYIAFLLGFWKRQMTGVTYQSATKPEFKEQRCEVRDKKVLVSELAPREC